MSREKESPVDMEKAMSLFDNDREFFIEMFGKFLDYIPGQIDRLSSAVSSGDARNVEIYAHGIRGAAANLWAVKACSIALTIERKGAEKDVAAVPSLIEDLRSEIRRLEDFFRTVL